MSTLLLAHFYTIPEVQTLADKVGDSLDLSLAAQNSDADVIVFGGVRFMAETAKLLNPNATVILPDAGSTCSLVTQTDVEELAKWDKEQRELSDKPTTHVMYINSSVEMKAIADIIVTSRNVEEIVMAEHEKGNNVIFSPDKNMGAYLNHTNKWNMPVWSAVCEVHEQFNERELDRLMDTIMTDTMFSDIPSIIAHPESPLPILQKADFVGSTSKMLEWVEQYDSMDTIIVATEDGILYNMRKLRPELDIIQAPIYKGCQCNSCPYMKLNTVNAVKSAMDGTGTVIDYIDPDLAERALLPIKRMMDFNNN